MCECNARLKAGTPLVNDQQTFDVLREELMQRIRSGQAAAEGRAMLAAEKSAAG